MCALKRHINGSLRLLHCSSFNDAFSVTQKKSDEWKSDKWMMNWKWFGRERSWPNFKVLTRHSLGETEENLGKPQSWYLVFGSIFEPGTFRIRSRSVNHGWHCRLYSSLQRYTGPESEVGEIKEKNTVIWDKCANMLAVCRRERKIPGYPNGCWV
jgi:hypothetical protein